MLASCKRCRMGVERDDGCEHAGEIVLRILERDSDDECGGDYSGARARGSLRNLTDWTQGDKLALQSLGDEWSCSARKFPWEAVVPLPSRPTAVSRRKSCGWNRRNFRGAGDFGLGDGIGDVIDEASKGENLALADELLREVGFEKLTSWGERPGEFGLAARVRL